MKSKPVLMIIMFGVMLIVSGCTPVVANRGNMVDPDVLAEVKTGSSTREDVATKLGSPSHVAPFDETTWYYIGRRTEQYSFFRPNVTDQQVVMVKFDDQGIVKTVETLDKNVARDVHVVSRETPTYGRETTLLQELFGNVGRPGIPMDKKTSRTGR
jgi:outer membrane protein assembly factor BamE (lipoprotein component of BamABCDE complex)